MSGDTPPSVVIVGAGVAGCTAALALASSHQVTLLDRQANPSPSPGECLPAAAGRILRQLDLWAIFQAQPHQPSLGMQSRWGGSTLSIQDGLRNPDGNAWHLDRPAFEHCLRRCAQERGVCLLAPDAIASAERQGTQWQLTLESKKTLQCHWVIDAGGRRAPFARKLGVQREVQDHLVAAWALYSDQQRRGPDQHMARISAAANGWFYSAPLPHGQRILAFHSDKTLLDTAKWRHAAPFVRAVRQHLPMADLLPECGDHSSMDYQGITAANSTRLKHCAGDGWAAVGDAAISFDPLSSQGMYNAMATSMQLAALLQNDRVAVAQSYNAQIERIWAHYLQHRHHYYRMETRWANQPFWQTRLA